VEVKLANPYKTKAIASARIKTDKLSARILAHLLRADLIAECQRGAQGGTAGQGSAPSEGVSGEDAYHG